MSDALPLLRGSLDILVLKAVSWGPMHGYEITRWIEDRSSRVFAVDDGALYHAIHRMEERRWITAEWGVTENNRRARYYRISPTGRAHLRAEAERWLQCAAALSDVLTATA
jgi:PadR family transcriptional regulator, regulatory protein PadR